MKKSTFGQKLTIIRKHFGINKTRMAEDLKTAKSNISRYERDLNKPTIDFIRSLLKVYNINLNWLFGENQEMLLSADNAVSVINDNEKKANKQTNKYLEFQSVGYTSFGVPIFDNLDENAQDKYSLPIVGAISAGEPIEVLHTSDNDFIPLPFYKTSKDLNNYLVFRVNGLSMHPDIHHEDIVFIYKNQNWIELNNKIVAVRIDGEMTLKKLSINNERKEIIFKALNKNFSDIVLNYEMMNNTSLVGELRAIRRVFNK